MILPLSGANAQFGINSRQGLELAADEINAGGGLKELGGARSTWSWPTPPHASNAATVAQRMMAENECCAMVRCLVADAGDSRGTSLPPLHRHRPARRGQGRQLQDLWTRPIRWASPMLRR